MTEFNLSDKIWDKESDVKPIILQDGIITVMNVKEFIKKREARLRNQIRIHWGWLKKKSKEEVADFIVSIANKDAGNKLT